MMFSDKISRDHLKTRTMPALRWVFWPLACVWNHFRSTVPRLLLFLSARYKWGAFHLICCVLRRGGISFSRHPDLSSIKTTDEIVFKGQMPWDELLIKNHEQLRRWNMVTKSFKKIFPTPNSRDLSTVEKKCTQENTDKSNGNGQGPCILGLVFEALVF